MGRGARFIEAAAARDGWALTGVGIEFASLGASALAAEAVTAAAHAHRRDNQPGPAAIASELRTRYLARCSALATPGTAAPGKGALTEREREVALRAALGTASSDIAAKLGVSRRTVDNHLGRVYDKLGIHTRNDLGRYFGHSSTHRGSNAPRDPTHSPGRRRT